MNACANHKERDADFYCSECLQCFCNDCARVKKFERTEIKVCPVCDDPLKTITVERDDPPFMSDLLDILRFPFHSYGLMALLVWPFFAVILRGIPVLIFSDFEDSIAYANPFFFLIYSVLIVAVFMQLAGGAGNGFFEFPTVRLRGSFLETLNESAARLFSPFIALFWPVIISSFIFWLAFKPSPSMGNQIILWTFLVFIFACCALAFFLLPMALLLTSMDTDPAHVFNPFFIFRHIGKIRRDYLIFLFGVAVFLAIYIFLREFVLWLLFSKSALFYIAYFFIDGAVHIYCAMTIGLLLGNLSYRRRYELKWLPHTDEKPEFKIETKSPVEAGLIIEPSLQEELAKKMSNASYFLNHGNFEDAAVVFHEVLDQYPDNFEALRGSVRAAFGLEDNVTVIKNGRKIAAQFAKQRAHEALWEMYRDYRKKVDDFVFDPPEMLEMARWLDEDCRMHLDAARVLRELAVSNPNDKCAAGALYKCAQLLWNKCDKPENATNVLDVLIEKHSDSEFVEKAKQLLEEIKTPK